MACVEDLFDTALARHVRATMEILGEQIAETDLRLVGAMAGETLGYVLAERAAGRLGNLNAALDWFEAYRARALAAMSADQAEDVLTLHAKYQKVESEVPLVERIKLSGTPLSATELVALGIAEGEIQDDLDLLEDCSFVPPSRESEDP